MLRKKFAAQTQVAEGAAVVSSSLRCGVQILPTCSNHFLPIWGLSGGSGGAVAIPIPSALQEHLSVSGSWGLVAKHGGAGNKITKDQPTGV